MKIAFVAHRANYLKHYGPIIDAALERGWNVECWLHEQGTDAGKTHLRISPEIVRKIWKDAVDLREFQDFVEVVDLAKQSKPDAVISLHPRSFYGSGDGARFITLQHSVDTFVEANPDELASSDYLCLNTPYWMDYARRFYEMSGKTMNEKQAKRLNENIAYTGFAQMDAFAKINRDEVRARWGIPSQQPVLLVLPVDLAGWPGVWPNFFASTAGRKQGKALLHGGFGFTVTYASWALKGWNDEALAQTFKQFCKNNNAFFLVKGREKDPLRAAWQARADRAFYDVDHYVPTIFEAIAISSLCVVFYSTAAQEAAYANVPSLCVDRPNKDMAKHKLWRSNKQGGPYNYDGVVQWKSMPDVLENFAEMQFSEFSIDPAAREKYLEIYNGPADYKASQRILDLVN